MKKIFSVLAVTMVLTSAMVMTSYAHGGHSGKNHTNRQTCYELCTTADCDVVGAHQHNDHWYCSRSGDGSGAGGGCGRYQRQ